MTRGRTTTAPCGRPPPTGPASPRRALLRAASLVGALAAGAPARATSPPGPDVPVPLRAALREGGCVLLLRHATTEPGVGDPPGFRLGECPTQRNLDARGRRQAERLGALVTALALPIGEVRSSRWCRCLDTARIAFGRVEPWPPLDSFFDDRSTRDAQVAAVRAWALAVRGPSNAVAVTHQVNVTALTGEYPSMGEAFVLRPEAGELRLLGRFVA